mmetsp:Transcript_203/g.440  ORF Transcript_203/g.440 Transcript_203/m.440 type:complete len:130 (-) Transcript_203:359-748(-)
MTISIIVGPVIFEWTIDQFMFRGMASLSLRCNSSLATAAIAIATTRATARQDSWFDKANGGFRIDTTVVQWWIPKRNNLEISWALWGLSCVCVCACKICWLRAVVDQQPNPRPRWRLVSRKKATTIATQ